MTGIVIPTYNEAGNLPTLIAGLAPLGAKLIVVDDGSEDGTADLAERAGALVIQRGEKLGLASAYVRGMTEALALGLDPIVQMDADLSHQPEDVPRLLEALSDADLVLGSRWVEGGGIENWEAGRRWLSKFGTGYARTLLGLPFEDLTGGFKAWRASTLASINLQTIRSEGYAFQVETSYRAHRTGHRISEVPIVFADRLSGTSKMSLGIAIEAAWVVPMLRWRGE
jgi:dolichol-phosphate mannosyltransferase